MRPMDTKPRKKQMQGIARILEEKRPGSSIGHRESGEKTTES